MNLLLLLGGTLRLTRFITTDTLGHWLIVQPARRWALWKYADLRHVHPAVRDAEWDSNLPTTARQRLVSGLDCPFCVGFWIGVAVLLSLAIARAVPPLLPLWRFAMGALSLNYVVGHLSSRVD